MALPIRFTGLESHVAQYGGNYKKLCKQFKYGASDAAIRRETGHSRNTIAKWRKQWEREQKAAVHQSALDDLSNV